MDQIENLKNNINQLFYIKIKIDLKNKLKTKLKYLKGTKQDI